MSDQKLIDDLIEERDQLAADCVKVRKILAGSDFGSLPNDWSLSDVAHARMEDIIKLTWQVHDTCARAEKAEKIINEFASLIGRTEQILESFDGMENSPFVKELRAAISKVESVHV